jgi:hypothetical protein
MGIVTSNLSISLDGFAAGPDESVGDPLGKGGERLHEWAIPTQSWRERHGLEGGERTPDAEVIEDVVRGVGAHIMARGMFGDGERLLDGVGDVSLEPVKVVGSPGATHVKYCVLR